MVGVASSWSAIRTAATSHARAEEEERAAMARTRKSKTAKRDLYPNFADAVDETDEDADLPKDEAGRRKIKRQYQELLGIRIEKLRGKILNRERINKTIEGIYFICFDCLKVCHSLDDGFIEDPNNQENLCAK